MGGGLLLIMDRSTRLRGSFSLIGLISATGGPGVAPIKPFQKRPAPETGEDSIMYLLGAMRVLGGARRGFCLNGAGVMMLC